jgi:ferredoxin-NADP reductase
MPIRQLELTIASVVAETQDAVTLVFERAPLEYKAGQFLSIDPHQFPVLEGFVAYLEKTKGRRERPRAYSMSSAPGAEPLAITIKEERYIPDECAYPPLLSPLLVRHMVPGLSLRATGFSGGFVLPDDIQPGAHVVHLAAGSGIVPCFSIVKAGLRARPDISQTLVYVNKTRADTIFRDALDELEHHHADRLRVIHHVTREQSERAREGRIDARSIQEALTDPQRDLIYICGPSISTHEKKAAKQRGEAPRPKFIETMSHELAGLGVPKENIYREWFG